MEHEVIVLPSALKRRFRAEDIAFAAKYPLVSDFLSTDRYLRIGMIGNVPVEIIGRYTDNDDFIVFHCMKCRKKYLDYLKGDYEH